MWTQPKARFQTSWSLSRLPAAAARSADWHSARWFLASWLWLIGLVLVGLAATMLLTTPVAAQEMRAEEVLSADPIAVSLQESFEILPLDRGVALIPLERLYGIRMIELEGQIVKVNGAEVSEEVLAAWLKADAGPVLSLMALNSDERRRVLGLAPLAVSTQESPGLLEAPDRSSSETVASELGAAESESSQDGLEAAGATTNELEASGAVRSEAEATGSESSGSGTAMREGMEASSAASPRSPSTTTGAEVSSDPEPERRRRTQSRVSSEARVSVGDSLTIPKHEVAEDVVVVGGSLRIEGEVIGNALVVAGPVWVEGKVTGDVASIGGKVHLEDGSRVHGDVVSIGGGVERDSSSTVLGEVTEVAISSGLFDTSKWLQRPDWGYRPRFENPLGGISNLVWATTKMLLLALVVCLVILLLRRPAEKAQKVIGEEPWKAGVVGLVAVIAFWALVVPLVLIVSLVLCITIIGIPIALLLGFVTLVAMIALPLLGYSASALRVGAWIDERFPWSVKGTYIRAFAGVVAIEVWAVVTAGVQGEGWILILPLALLGLFGVLARFTAWTVGLGGVLLTLYRSSSLSSSTTGSIPYSPPPEDSEPEWDDDVMDLPPLPTFSEPLDETDSGDSTDSDSETEDPPDADTDRRSAEDP